jgi:hypothetical protein
MTKTEKIAYSILRPINPSLIIVLGTYTILWGLWILNPFTDVFAAAALYSVMASLAGEWFWGGIAILSGLFVIRGALKPSYFNLRLGSFIGFFHWFIITLMYFAGDIVNTGGITALTFAVYSALVWLNIKVNRVLYEDNS